MEKSLYIHIPFCRKKCPYCDFYSIPYKKNSAAAYVKVLSKQIKALDGDFSTIYIGGGTPTVLDKNLFSKLLTSLRKIAKAACEFTVEANPESLNFDKARLFLDQGVNRISIGVQSLGDSKLKKLCRLHSARQGLDAVSISKKAGFKNISIDLIFGLEGESSEEWKQELKEAANLPITHISTYALTYEKNTPFFKQLKEKKITPSTAQLTAMMYKSAISYLPKKSFLHYEVSNFARKGYSCRHNLNYWNNSYYLGLGPGAASFLKGVRKQNVFNVKEYIDRVNKGLNPGFFKEKLPPLSRAKELAALKIRTKEGIDFNWFKNCTGFDFMELETDALKEQIATSLLRYRKQKGKTTGVYLTKKGFLFCDTASSSFL